jgi:GT2 family glycosyltransferase
VKIAVIVLNWNGRQFLPECLDSLAAQTMRDFEVVLVDNGSADGSPLYIRDAYPWVKLVELPENIGFAAGNNRGLEAAAGEFIVALNNDTRVEPDFLAELLAAAQAFPGAGMVAAKMLNYFEPGRIDAVALKIGVNGLGYNIGYGERDAGQYDVGVAAFGPCGGAALYRRAMIEKIGFFDPDFFAYYEDFDLAWRGRLAGWGCVCAPRAVVHHVHSATSGEYSPFKVYQTQRNKWYVIAKNWPGVLILRHLPALLFADAASFALALARGRGGAALRARLDFLRNLPGLLQKRRELERARLLSNREVAALFSPHEHPVKTLRRKLGWKGQNQRL